MDITIPTLTKREIGTIGLSSPSLRSIPGKIIEYGNISCEGTLLSADQIILRWGTDRHSIARCVSSSKLSDPWTGLVSQDDSCGCRLGDTGKPFTCPIACTGCNVSSRLFKKGDIVQEHPFTIQVGKYIGTKYALHSFKKGLDVGFGFKGYERTDAPMVVGSLLLDHMSALQACETSFSTHVQNTSFWACKGSPIEHYIMISCFLENEMHKGGFPTIPTFRWSFQCDGNINVVEEVLSLGKGTLTGVSSVSEYVESPRSPTARSSPITPLTSDTSRGIILQLVSTLHFLNRYAFTHGSPSLNCLGFSKTPSAYIYDDVKISSPVGLRIIPSTTSALSAAGINGSAVRIYHPGLILDQSVNHKLLPKIVITPFIGIKQSDSFCNASSRADSLVVMSNPCLPEYIRLRIIGYKIGSNTNSFTSYVQHLGIPLFHSSFDLYAFWVALMCESPFYQAVHNDQPLLDIWRQLWNPSEYDTMMNELQIVRQRSEHDVPLAPSDIVTFVSSYYLRCDALENTWQHLKNLSS